MDDALIQLILRGMGVGPDHPDYATYASALRSRAQAENDAQGVWFEEDTRRYDNTLENAVEQTRNQRRQIDNQYEVAKAGVRNDRERIALDRWKAEQDNRLREAEIAIQQGNLQLARDRLGLDTELGRGRLALDTELGRGRLDLDRGTQGLDLLRTTVDLNSQVRNWAKAMDWRRGVRDNPDAPVFLRNLLASSGAAAGSHAPYSVAAPGLPEQNTLAATLADLGVGQGAPAQQANAAPQGTGAAAGTPAMPSADKDPRDAALMAAVKAYTPSDGDGYDVKDIAALKTIAAIAAQGTAKSANRVGMMDKDEQEFLAGGLDRLGIGGDWWLRDAERKRWGGGTASGLVA